MGLQRALNKYRIEIVGTREKIATAVKGILAIMKLETSGNDEYLTNLAKDEGYLQELLSFLED